jgi:hypothetical protein
MSSAARRGPAMAIRRGRSVSERSSSEDILSFFEGCQHSSHNVGLALIARGLLWLQRRLPARLQERRAFWAPSLLAFAGSRLLEAVANPSYRVAW